VTTQPAAEPSPDRADSGKSFSRRSDQRPGEEAVQVNDSYRGKKPPPESESEPEPDDQHPTGG
jgi:hypothetical protein